MANRILGDVIANQEVVQNRGDSLAELQRAMDIIQRDVLSLSSRSVRDVLGDSLEPLIIRPDGSVELSREGWRNPLDLPRATTQRVGYTLVDDTLYRVYWPVLDRAPDTEPVEQRLLSDVVSFSVLVVDVSGNEHSFWPRVGGDDAPDAALAGLILRVETERLGEIERLWVVPVDRS